MIKLGCHVNISKGLLTAPSHAQSQGANVYQIYLNSPRSYTNTVRDDSVYEKLKKNNKKYGTEMVIHGSLLCNLCRDPEQNINDIFSKSVNIVVNDLNTSVKIGAIGVVIHMGKNTEKNTLENCKNNYVTGIHEILSKSDAKSTLILETGAGCGTEVSSSLKELGEIRKAVDKQYRDRVKFCLDTCHMFSVGETFDMNFEDKVEECLGWDNVVIVHLNDSKTPCNSRKDRHHDIGRGTINFHNLMSFVDICIRKDIPMVLETPCEEYNGVQYTSEKQIEKIIKYHDIMYKNLGPYHIIDDVIDTTNTKKTKNTKKIKAKKTKAKNTKKTKAKTKVKKAVKTTVKK